MDNDRDILLIAMFTMLTVFLWIFFELAKTTKTTTVSQSTQQAVVSLSSDLDIPLLTTLSERKQY